MKKQQIRLSESDFNRLIKETVNQIVKARLNEGFASADMSDKFDKLAHRLGFDAFVTEVYNFFNADELEEFMRSVDNDWNLGLFDYGEDDNEEDDDFEISKSQIGNYY